MREADEMANLLVSRAMFSLTAFQILSIKSWVVINRHSIIAIMTDRVTGIFLIVLIRKECSLPLILGLIYLAESAPI